MKRVAIMKTTRRNFFKITGIGFCSALLGLYKFPKAKEKPEEIKTIITTISRKDNLYINSKYIDQFRRELLHKSKQIGSKLKLTYLIK